MKSLADRIKTKRKEKRLTMEALGKLVGVSKSSVSQWESGLTKKMDGENLVTLANALGVNAYWLSTGKNPDYIDGEVTHIERPKIESNAVYLGGFDVWDSDTPLDDDEVALPFFREVKLSAGSGAITQVIENHGFKLRFAKSTLRKAGVQQDYAYCVTVEGCSMEPVLPNGCTVGVNTIDTAIQDGKAYAIDQNGELRVKLLYKIAGGGIRVRSYNRDEYPDEIITGVALDGFKILGRMFWYSVLL